MAHKNAAGELMIKKSKLDSGLLIEMEGVLNSDTSKDVRPELLEISGQNHLILDLSNVSLITSSGVGVLFEITDKSLASEKKVILLNPSERVQKVINITGFNDLFIIADSLESAKKLIS
jgi:anti-sigma B factor antagonist